jgi:hypothetical protein
VDEPVANIELELTSDAGSPHFSTKSDSKGSFSFRSIPKGDYTLHAEAHGFVKAGRKLRVTVNRRAKCAPKITIRLGIGDDCGSPITIKGFDGPAELESERQQYYRSRKQPDPKQ